MCVEKCPEKAITRPGNRDVTVCTQCFSCVKNCPSGAMEGFGEMYSIESIRDILLPEYPFYRDSGGGVTFSGGEPTLHVNFITRLAHRLKEDQISVALETCGDFSPDLYSDKAQPSCGEENKHLKAESLPVSTLFSEIDLILFDIKLFDEKKHRIFCGKGNARIKENLKNLSRLSQNSTGPVLWPRMPIVPGITDTMENLSEWATFLLDMELPYLTLVPYHNLGNAKREWLNLKPAPDIPVLKDEALQKVTHQLNALGISCFSPGEENWSGRDDEKQ